MFVYTGYLPFSVVLLIILTVNLRRTFCSIRDSAERDCVHDVCVGGDRGRGWDGGR